MYDLIAIAGGYVLGSIPFALIITRMFGIKDIRKVGSGNIGATNAWRAAGPVAGILVSIGDIGKGVLAVILASLMPQSALDLANLKLIAGIAAVFGHVFPLFLRFRGGKGVNTALGVMIMILPIETLIALAGFIITVAISRYISLGSVLASVFFFAAVLISYIFKLHEMPLLYLIISALLMLLIIITHRSNISRLLSGGENKFDFHSRYNTERADHV
ncbi:MAG: acyl-phosphate glycerol 3-phosphate acyltransferase [candidate division Zixibacteria bacterium HGW-Zixibacteria-1]|nr:MAG: acyl-phosphate glycerol 3-phosphate acyltransferase [candidate division Zixibacteria bacterium HGW-Zixibacteria-1]